MQALSQKKKIGILAGAIVLLTIVTLVSTGRMSLSGLSSSAITSSNYVCNDKNQAKNLTQYNQIPNNIVNANNKIHIISGEIKVIQDKINTHNTTITQKQLQITTRPTEIVRLNGLISPLTTFINTYCKNPTGSMVRTCNDKKKERLKYENNIAKLNALENDIKKLQNEIGTEDNKNTLKGKIKIKQNQNDIWRNKIGEYELFKKKYDRCGLELKTKPTVSSSSISWEVRVISGELGAPDKLISGEVILYTGTIYSPFVSWEIIMSSEVGMIPLLTTDIQKMEFSVQPTPENNLNIKEWFLEFDTNNRIQCAPKQISSNPVNIKLTCSIPTTTTQSIFIEPGLSKGYKLWGKLGSVTLPLAVKVDFLSLQYNQGRTDIDKKTFPVQLTVVVGNDEPDICTIAPDLCPPLSCESIQGSTECLKQNRCYYNEKTSKCTSEVLKCEDASDAQDDIFTKGMIWGFARHVYSPRYYQASYDYCTGDKINQVSCDSEGFAKYTSSDCPNGCSDGVCKPADPVAEVCEDLAITPSTIQGGGTVNYTCQASNDILCVLDPTFCKPKAYSVVIKKPDGGVVQTYTTATGSVTIPSNPTGTYTAECFVNGQTTTIAACKKTITNQEPVIACTGTLPTNATILNNVGTTSHAWTYDGSPTGPYQNCSFKCPTGTTYSNNACNPAPVWNLLVSLSPATPWIGYATGWSTVVTAVFDFKAENIQHTVKQLKFKVGSSEANSAINSIQLYDGSNTIGSPSVFIGNNATIDVLNLIIPANTSKTIIVKLTLNSIGVGAGLSQSNVWLTLDEVSYQNDTNGTLSTNTTDIVANAKYVYQSFPILTQIPVDTSTKIANGAARDILKFSIAAPVTATTSSGISVKQIRFPISWIDGGASGDTLEVEALKLSIDGTDVTASDVTIQDQNGASVESTSGLTESDNYLIITWDSNKELTIGAGQIRILTLRGTMQGFNMGDQEISPADSFTIGFQPDTSHNGTSRYLTYANTTNTLIGLYGGPAVPSAIVPYNFIWSDMNASSHTWAVGSASSNDWANSYPILSELPKQTFSN